MAMSIPYEIAKEYVPGELKKDPFGLKEKYPELWHELIQSVGEQFARREPVLRQKVEEKMKAVQKGITDPHWLGLMVVPEEALLMQTIPGVQRFLSKVAKRDPKALRAYEAQLEKGVMRKLGEGAFGTSLQPRALRRGAEHAEAAFKVRGSELRSGIGTGPQLGEAHLEKDLIKALRSTEGLRRSVPKFLRRHKNVVTMEFKPHVAWDDFGKNMTNEEQMESFLYWADDLRKRFHELADRGYVHLDHAPRNIKMGPNGEAVILDIDEQFIKHVGKERAEQMVDGIWRSAVTGASRASTNAEAIYSHDAFGAGTRGELVHKALKGISTGELTLAEAADPVAFWSKASDIADPSAGPGALLWPGERPVAGTVNPEIHEQVMKAQPLFKLTPPTQKKLAEPIIADMQEFSNRVQQGMVPPTSFHQAPTPTPVPEKTSIMPWELPRGKVTVSSHEQWARFQPMLKNEILNLLDQHGIASKEYAHAMANWMVDSKGFIRIPEGFTDQQLIRLAKRTAQDLVQPTSPINVPSQMGTQTRYGMRTPEPLKVSREMEPMVMDDQQLFNEARRLNSLLGKPGWEMESSRHALLQDRLEEVLDAIYQRGGRDWWGGKAPKEYPLSMLDNLQAASQLNKRAAFYQQPQVMKPREGWGAREIQNKITGEPYEELVPQGSWTPATEYPPPFGLQEPMNLGSPVREAPLVKQAEEEASDLIKELLEGGGSW